MKAEQQSNHNFAIIGDNQYAVNDDCTKCFYGFEWHTIYTVPDKFGALNPGAKYLLFRDKRRYISEIIN